MTSSIVVLGAGFGGLELCSRLAGRPDCELTLIDQADSFVFGYAKLDVMFGRKDVTEVRHPYRDLTKPDVRFVSATVTAIDPRTGRIESDAGVFDADILVVALGADLDPGATPGLIEDGYEFYTVDGALAAARAIESFAGGRVIVGVTSTPFKCPPAPSETALLMHEYLASKGLLDRSDVSLVMPMSTPLPPAPDASRELLRRFAAQGIGWHPDRLVRALDPQRHVAVFADGGELPYDLFLGIPVHRAPQVVVEAGLTADGWIPVDALTLETSFPGVYAIGDVTSIGTPKAGVYAEGQAAIVADRIAETLDGHRAQAEYDGRGNCYIEFGAGEVGRVDVTFRSGQPPVGTLDGPSLEITADKVEFGSSRIARWFH